MADGKQSEQDLPETFEDALHELQRIVGELESGSENLETSLTEFERGVRILKSCHKLLDEAEQRIEIVTRVSDESIETQPFENSASIDSGVGSARGSKSKSTPRKRSRRSNGDGVHDSAESRPAADPDDSDSLDSDDQTLF